MATFPGIGNGKMAVPVAFLAVALSGTASEVKVWTNIGPDGGRVSALAADPRNPASLYAATGAGIFKTIDGGANWTIVNFSQPGTPLVDLVAIDTAGTLYAGARLVSGFEDYFKSTDGGTSWSAIGFGAAGVCHGLLVVDSVHPGMLYAAGGNGLQGVCKSTDGGATWTLVNAKVGLGGNTDLVWLLATDPFDARTLYAATTFGFYKSTNGGANWSLANSGLPQITDPAVGWRDRGLALDPQNPGTLYYGKLGRIFKSTDGAVSWNDAGSGLPPAPANGWSAVGSIAGNPQNPASIYAVITQNPLGPPPDRNFPFFSLVTSSDGGASWITATDPTLLVAPVPGSAGAATDGITSISPDPLDPNTLYLGTAKGVLKSTDGGGRWNFANSGLKAVGGMWQVLIDTQSPTILAPPYKSSDGGATWSRYALPSGLGGLMADPQNPHTLYGLDGQAFYKSTDFGDSWTQIGSIPWNSGQFVVSSKFPNIMYGIGQSSDGNTPSLFKSVDGGHTWSVSTLGLNGEPPAAIAVDPQDPNIIYVSTSAPYPNTGEIAYLSLWKSADGGVTWMRLRGPNETFSSGPILIDPQNPGTIYFADTDRGQNSSWLFYSDTQWHKSADGGATWTQIFPSCGQPSFESVLLPTLLIDPRNSNTLYAGSGGVGGAVCESTDGGASWTAAGPGLTGRAQALAFAPTDSRTLYAAMSNGLFVITLQPSSVPSVLKPE